MDGCHWLLTVIWLMQVADLQVNLKQEQIIVEEKKAKTGALIETIGQEKAVVDEAVEAGREDEEAAAKLQVSEAVQQYPVVFIHIVLMTYTSCMQTPASLLFVVLAHFVPRACIKVDKQISRCCVCVQSEVTAFAEECTRDLAAAEPVIKEAEAALNSLDKGSLGELKSFGSPAAEVVQVVSACIVLTAPGGKIPKVSSAHHSWQHNEL